MIFGGFCMKPVEAQLKQIKKEFEKKKGLLESQVGKIYVVNAGNMNHGKSSMLNSLLNREMFKTEDIRTTVSCDEATYKDNVIFVDTPGIGANASDDATALKAYKRADLILFVHNPSVGELHDFEVRQIGKLIDLFPDSKEFWKRFCLVMTYKEGDKNQSHDLIQQNIEERLSKEFHATGFPVFRISNTRYQKGTRENKKNLVAQSGIPELRTYIEKTVDKLKNANIALQEKRLEQLKKETCHQINQLKTQVQESKKEKTKSVEEMSRIVLSSMDQYAQECGKLSKQKDELSLKSAKLKKERDELQERWERERY